MALGHGPVDPEALLQAADAAMYEAKRAGEGVRFAVEAMTEPKNTIVNLVS